MKSKLLILTAAAIVLVSFSFATSKGGNQSTHPTATKSGKTMVDKDQFN